MTDTVFVACSDENGKSTIVTANVSSSLGDIEKRANAVETAKENGGRYPFITFGGGEYSSLLDAGESARILEGRNIWLVHGMIGADNQGLAFNVEAETQEEAVDWLMAELVKSTSFDSVAAYYDAAGRGLVPDNELITICNIDPVTDSLDFAK